jgi:hypothetical protein
MGWCDPPMYRSQDEREKDCKVCLSVMNCTNLAVAWNDRRRPRSSPTLELQPQPTYLQGIGSLPKEAPTIYFRHANSSRILSSSNIISRPVSPCQRSTLLTHNSSRAHITPSVLILCIHLASIMSGMKLCVLGLAVFALALCAAGTPTCSDVCITSSSDISYVVRTGSKETSRPASKGKYGCYSQEDMRDAGEHCWQPAPALCSLLFTIATALRAVATASDQCC